LLLIGTDGTAKRLSDEPVISFAGWDVSGTHIAYVAAEPLKYIAPWLRLLTIASDSSQVAPLISMIGMPYAALVLPNLHARTAIWDADANGENPKKLLGGVHATFLHWSPREPKLSVWLTVEPPYRLVESAPGMRTGDPAAIIDAETGKVEWMPVNGTEHAQIGHIALRAGRVEEAIREFDLAAATLPPDGKADWMFFRAIALRKAGRQTEAEAAMQRFEPPASIQMNSLGLVAAFSRDQWLGQVGETMTARHRFAAEAYLSLDMLDEAIEFLRGELRSASSDRERLSAAVVLGQLLLLGDRRREYAVLAADEVVPTAARVLTMAKTAPSAESRRAAISTTVALAILPLAVDGFVESLPPDTVRKVSTRFASFTPAADDLDFAIQLVLRNCGRQLKDAALTERASVGLVTHPARGRFHLPANGEVTLIYLLGCRMMFRIAEEFNERFAADVVPVRK
ncbi:MAG TPA: hypothetical protein VLM40_17825, partial [Gemmata sp.]|nr:hypothetical protein [Gemmata sp.]